YVSPSECAMPYLVLQLSGHELDRSKYGRLTLVRVQIKVFAQVHALVVKFTGNCGFGDQSPSISSVAVGDHPGYIIQMGHAQVVYDFCNGGAVLRDSRRGGGSSESVLETR